jgi:serine/threonine-protein kinase HipA
MTTTAQVFLYGEFVGSLHKEAHAYSFQYQQDYHGQPLSLSLPVSDTPYTLPHLHPFFASLVAEGWLKNKMCRSQHIAHDDLFTLLINNGDDLIGAVKITRG